MKKIIVTIMSLLVITSCRPSTSNSTSSTSPTNELIKTSGAELIKTSGAELIKTSGAEVIRIVNYNDTKRGMSIVTLSTGERFIYCETQNGVAICQIINNSTHEHELNSLTVDTTSLY